jgi:glyoxylase-like metal-dependent hydrolase (beta-lactamase superfamily II)
MKFVTLSANNPGIYTGPTGNNTYLFPGAVPTLIDAGVGDGRHIEAIAGALDSFGGAPLARVIVTHAHHDHASGAAAIAARWPGARFFKFPWPERDSRYPVIWEPLEDADLVAAGDEQLLIVHTPGHAPDHISLWHAPTRELFSGDLAVIGTTVVIPGGKGGSVSRYIRSLERVLALQPSVLLTAHGAAIYHVERVLRGYIAHRLERERQIVAALADGARTPDHILAQLYPSIHPQLAESARASIVAHLEKLQEERRADVGGDGCWMLLSSSAGPTC